MSKLFDQLQGAARDREGGLLLDAMAKKQQLDDEAAKTAASFAPPAEAGPAVSAPAPAAQLATEPLPAASRASLGGIALAAGIFVVAVVAWHSAPWRAPQKVKIDPATLKLDRGLDLKRPSSEGTTPPSRPS